MSHCLFLLLRFALLAALSLAAQAAEPRLNPDASDSARTLSEGGQPIVMLLAKQGAQTPEQRVLRARERGQALDETDLRQSVRLAPFNADGARALLFSLNGKPLFVLSERDLDPGDFLSLDEAGQRVLSRLEQARLAALELHSPQHMLQAAGLALLASLALAAACWLIYRLRGRFRRRLLGGERAGARYDLATLLHLAEGWLLDLTALLLAALAAYAWLGFVLGQFPYTRAWGRQLGSASFQLLSEAAGGLLSALPGLAAVLVIFLLTRLLARLLELFFGAVARGQVLLPGLHAETAGATRRLAVMVLWLFALIVAYPYLPGAQSDAFKGVSVFFGLMVTLGSTGIMSHAMSGLVLIYSRALRPGDVVRVGDVEGTVSELSALSTKIVTRQDIEVTLPNAVVVGGKVVNLSRRERGQGTALFVSVTIGYDAPWRQVQGLLELAASRTPGLSQEAPPRVRQIALQDFYVEYELLVSLLPGQALSDARNALNGQIQDAFNEFGVQIMSPHFRAQPEQDVLVPREHWRDAPARKEE